MKRNTEHRRSNKKIIAMLSVLTVLALAVTGYPVSGTVAWLASKSESTVSTFTIGDINITLTESSADSQPVKIIPGIDIGKTPKVTVKPNSEACWLFVKAEETNWPNFMDANGTARKVSYSVAAGDNGWKALENVPGVYYREVSAENAKNGIAYYVLAGSAEHPNGVVTVSRELTKTEVNSLAGAQPKLTFTAYAVQREGIDDAAAAWAAAQN